MLTFKKCLDLELSEMSFKIPFWIVQISFSYSRIFFCPIPLCRAIRKTNKPFKIYHSKWISKGVSSALGCHDRKKWFLHFQVKLFQKHDVLEKFQKFKIRKNETAISYVVMFTHVWQLLYIKQYVYLSWISDKLWNICSRKNRRQSVLVHENF